MPSVMGNTCCQCGAVGAVQNKYLPEESRALGSPIPILWRCAVCERHVCINCALIKPGSAPIELAEDTLCSEACQGRLPGRRSLPSRTRAAAERPPGDPVEEAIGDAAERLYFGEEATWGLVGVSPYDAVLVVGCYEASDGQTTRTFSTAAYREGVDCGSARSAMIERLEKLVAELKSGEKLERMHA